MSDPEERWAAVGEAISARIAELQMTKNEVIRASGVSYKSLSGYIEGQPIRRADKARGLCEALRWPPDAIDRILAGEPPIAEYTDLDFVRAAIGRTRHDVGEVPRSATQSIALSIADELERELAEGERPDVGKAIGLLQEVERIGTKFEDFGDGDPPPTSPGAELPDEVLGLAAKAGKLSPEARAKLEGYIDALLDEEG